MKNLISIRLITCSVLLLASFTMMSMAQDPNSNLKELSLDELLDLKVTSPSRKLESVRETASSVLVIKREELLASGARDLRDAMRLVPGVQSINNSDERLI